MEIDLIWAVEHNTKNSDSFGKIFSWLSFTSTGGSSRVGAKFNVESTSNCDPASVG